MTRLRAVGGNAGELPESVIDGTVFPGVAELKIYGLVQWTNTESADHTVEVVTGCSTMCHISTWSEKTILPKGTNTADVLLAKFYSSVAQGFQQANVSVMLKGPSGDSSALSTTITADLSSIGAFSSNASLSFGTAIILPTWTNPLWKPAITIVDNINGALVANVDLSALSSDKIPLPNSLVAGRQYKAIIQGRPDFSRQTDYTNQGRLVTYYRILPASAGIQNFVFSLSESENPFTVVSESLKYLGGQFIKTPLTASHAASWAITSGPTGFSIIEENGQYFLAGTAPSSLSTLSFSLTATRVSDSATAIARITIGIVSVIDRVQIIVNPGWLNNGLSYTVGDAVSVALASNPQGGVVWSATGLPPGLSVDRSTGLISGRVTVAGRYLANIVASDNTGGIKPLPGPETLIPLPGSTKLLPSLPAVISFTIREASSGDGSTTNPNAPAVRIPWILAKWNLADLQVLARTREVQSTLFGKTPLSLKVGDNVNFAVLFIGADDRPFQLAPDRLRLTIRPADNLEAALVFESETSPAAVTTEPDPYYLIAASTAGRQRQTVQEWVEDSGKNEPLACVADVDWIKDGQHFSSASFPVLLELDVTRP